MDKQQKIQHYKEKAEKYGFILLEECLSNTQRVWMCCKDHKNYKKKISLKSLRVRCFCPYCKQTQRAQGRKVPYDKVREEFEKAGYELLTEEKDYKNALQKLDYICSIHGKRQISFGHLTEGKRCAECSKKVVSKKARLSAEKVNYELDRRGFIWLDRNYKRADIPLKLSCKKHSDKIFYITYSHIVHAKTKCPFCYNISQGEKEIYRILEEHNIDFIYQQKMKDLYRYKGQYLSYDFYIPSQNLLIEYQGQYHKKITNFNTKEHLVDQQERDRMKREYAKEKGYNLLEIWYKDINKIEQILLKERVINCVDPISLANPDFSTNDEHLGW